MDIVRTVTVDCPVDEVSAKLAAPLLSPAFQRLGDEDQKGLRDALTRL